MTVEGGVEGWINRVVKNQALIRRYMFIPQAIAGVLLLIVAYSMGHTHLHLILVGVRAPGRIVGHQQRDFQDNSSNTSSTLAFMPIVEFEAGERTVRFEDWLGSARRAGRSS